MLAQEHDLSFALIGGVGWGGVGGGRAKKCLYKNLLAGKHPAALSEDNAFLCLERYSVIAGSICRELGESSIKKAGTSGRGGRRRHHNVLAALDPVPHAGEPGDVVGHHPQVLAAGAGSLARPDGLEAHRNHHRPEVGHEAVLHHIVGPAVHFGW